MRRKIVYLQLSVVNVQLSFIVIDIICHIRDIGWLYRFNSLTIHAIQDIWLSVSTFMSLNSSFNVAGLRLPSSKKSLGAMPK